MNNPKSFSQKKNGGLEHQNTKMIISETYEGHLPSPEMMEKYNAIDPTFANRILSLTEKEQNHSHLLDRRQTKNIFISMYLGIACAFLSVLIVSYLVYLCLEKGFPGAASTIAVGVLVGIAGVFMYQRKKSKKDN